MVGYVQIPYCFRRLPRWIAFRSKKMVSGAFSVEKMQGLVLCLVLGTASSTASASPWSHPLDCGSVPLGVVVRSLLKSDGKRQAPFDTMLRRVRDVRVSMAAEALRMDGHERVPLDEMDGVDKAADGISTASPFVSSIRACSSRRFLRVEMS